MVAVHVSNDLGLRGNELGGVAGLGQNLLRREIDDAAEAGNEMHRLERHPVEGEIGKVGEHVRLGLTVEVPAADTRVVVRCRSAHEHDTGALQALDWKK